jgi:hypothetical protein
MNITKIKQTMEVSQQEKQGILRAIDLYVEGGRKASGKIAAEAFSPTATMSWTVEMMSANKMNCRVRC